MSFYDLVTTVWMNRRHREPYSEVLRVCAREYVKYLKNNQGTINARRQA